jgi:hypothetical protein
MVGDRDRRHRKLLGPVDKRPNARRTVKQAQVRVNMKMNERGVAHKNRTPFLKRKGWIMKDEG